MMSSILHLLLLTGAFASQQPDKRAKWYSIDETTQFQPALRRLAKEAESLDQDTLFADALDTYYDAYQTAWRYMGFHIECSPFEEYYENQRRDLQEDEYIEGDQRCRRLLLWAAYVDLDYEGGGTAEYQYYDVYENEWDTTACETRFNQRCAKMDCHEPGTHWTLLGFYKEAGYTRWFEQLFKHQGYCIWNHEGVFEFMYGYYNAWPRECTAAPSSAEDGTPLYYEMKPVADGNMTIGLYTDQRCAMEYQGELAVDEVLGNLAIQVGGDGNNNQNNDNDYENWNAGLILGQYAEAWNEAMSIYKVCQPCRAYNLQMNYVSNGNRQLGDNYYGPNDGYFQCYDAAGYTDVNQCMKFRTKTSMEPASFQEVMTASQQGNLLQTEIEGVIYGKPLSTTGKTQLATEKAEVDRMLFASSLTVLAIGVVSLVSVLYWLRSQRNNSPVLNEALLS